MKGVVSPSVRMYLDPSLRQASASVQDEAGADGSLGGGAGGGAVGGGVGGANLKRKAVSSVFAGFLDPMDVSLDAIHVLHDGKVVNLIPETTNETKRLLHVFKGERSDLDFFKYIGKRSIAAVLDQGGKFSLCVDRKLIKSFEGADADTAFSALQIAPLQHMTNWFAVIVAHLRPKERAFLSDAFLFGGASNPTRHPKARVRATGFFTNPTADAPCEPTEATLPFLKYVKENGYQNGVELLAKTIVQWPHSEQDACFTTCLGTGSHGQKTHDLLGQDFYSIWKACKIGHTEKHVVAAEPSPSSTSSKSGGSDDKKPMIPGATYVEEDKPKKKKKKKKKSTDTKSAHAPAQAPSPPPLPILMDHWAETYTP